VVDAYSVINVVIHWPYCCCCCFCSRNKKKFP